MLNDILQKNPELYDILNNIKKNQELIDNNKSPRIIGLISGSEENKQFLEKRFRSQEIFKNTFIFSTVEETRKSNFLGTLLFYKKLKALDIDFKNDVVLCGMVFGKGERITPITNVLRNMKPSMPTARSLKYKDKIYQETLIETAIRYFSLPYSYLRENNFRGILDKWGDEIQIPGIDIFKNNIDLKDIDLIKVVSEQVVNIDNAKEKDWVSYDKENNLLRQIPRRPFKDFEALYNQGLVRKNENNEYVCGISLGPVAVSYKFLDVAIEVFKDELEKEGVYFDFDPYFIMALALVQEKDGKAIWDKEKDKKVLELDKMMIKNKYGSDFFEKVMSFTVEFEKKYNRKINSKVLNFGNLYWADLGSHKAMREYFMSLKDDSKNGYITREISNIPHEKDKNGNIIINSVLDNVDVYDSVILNSHIYRGKINESVIINGIYHDIDSYSAFSVDDKVHSMKLEKHSGSIKTLSLDPIKIKEKTRHVSALLKEGIVHFKVSEEDDLRSELYLNHPINDNDRSFKALYKEVLDVSEEENERIIKEFEKRLNDKIKSSEDK